MGKVGQVFHPEQDRIVSVRECARAQVSMLCTEWPACNIMHVRDSLQGLDCPSVCHHDQQQLLHALYILSVVQ